MNLSHLTQPRIKSIAASASGKEVLSIVRIVAVSRKASDPNRTNRFGGTGISVCTRHSYVTAVRACSVPNAAFRRFRHRLRELCTRFRFRFGRNDGKAVCEQDTVSGRLKILVCRFVRRFFQPGGFLGRQGDISVGREMLPMMSVALASFGTSKCDQVGRIYDEKLQPG